MPSGEPRPGELVDRFVARLLDGLILLVVNVVLIGPLIIGAALTSAAGLDDGGFVTGAMRAVLSAAISLGYFSWMESSQGRTVGKMAMRLRTLGPHGSNPTFEQALRRNVWVGLGVLGVVPVIGSLIGGLAELVAVILIAVGINGDPVRRQGWHDRFAGGTRVIKEG
jgi:uncharacterized RDD family membrane protein YckC